MDKINEDKFTDFANYFNKEILPIIRNSESDSELDNFKGLVRQRRVEVEEAKKRREQS